MDCKLGDAKQMWQNLLFSTKLPTKVVAYVTVLNNQFIKLFYNISNVNLCHDI